MYARLIRLIDTGNWEPRTKLSQIAGEFGLTALICLSVLSPNFQISGTLPMIRLDLPVLILITATFIWFLLAGLGGTLQALRFYWIGACFSISVSLSLFYGTTVLHNTPQLSDFYEISKAWLPVVFFVVGYEAHLSERGIHRLLNALALVALMICIIGWIQFLNLPLAPRLQAIYGDGGHNDRALLLFRRVYSTLTNPNVLGEFLSWTLVGYTIAFLFHRGSRVRNLLVCFCCMITLTMTGSRYGILSASLGLILVLAMARHAIRNSQTVITLALLLMIFVAVFTGIQHVSYFTAQRFEELRDPLQVNSLRGRLDDLWIVASDYFWQSPVFGQGPAKRVFDEAYTDSEYLDVLKKFGVVGFSIYLGYYLWPLAQIRRALRNNSRMYPPLEGILPGNLFAARYGFVMLCMALFMNIGMYTCFNWYLMCFLWTWTGISMRSAAVMQEVIECLLYLPASGPPALARSQTARFPYPKKPEGMSYA